MNIAIKTVIFKAIIVIFAEYSCELQHIERVFSQHNVYAKDVFVNP